MKKILLLFILAHSGLFCQNSDQIITRQGQVSFFSYTSVENIEATNNQVRSAINIKNGSVGVKMLMRAFTFKKSLMEEHFNESYVESDIYPECVFYGEIVDYDNDLRNQDIAFIKGIMEMHGKKTELTIKVNAEWLNDNLVLTGNFEVPIEVFNIRVPRLLAPNIAKVIQVMFRFEYEPYEE